MFKSDKIKTFKYPGIRMAMDGNGAVILCERESTDAAGAYPITPSTQMGEYWAEEAAKGHLNISGRPLIFIEPESEHAAAAVTAGLAMTGLRATNFSSSQGVVFMHESLYGAVGKRLTYVLNIGCRAITKSTLNVHASHDDYHSIDDTGFFQVMAKNAQEACDLNIIAHKTAELALNPGIVAQDGFLTTHLIETVYIPEKALIEEFLGKPDDIIETPTPAQKMIYGDQRRRIPTLWDVDNPMSAGNVQNQDSYMQAVAAQRPYFFAHIPALADQAMDEFYQLSGRRYRRVSGYKTEDADYLIVGQGSMISTAEAVADYLRDSRKLKVGVVNLTMFRPFPGGLLAEQLIGKKGAVVLERTDQPLAEDLPLMRETRAALSKALENGVAKKLALSKVEGGETLPYAEYPACKPEQMPSLYSGSYGLGSRDLQPEGLLGAVENMLPNGAKKKFFYLSVEFLHKHPETPKQELFQQNLLEAYPRLENLAVRGSENPNLMPKNAITVRFHSVGGWGAVTTGKNLAMTLFDLLDYNIKANPKYGSEKKGQPTTYYLCAAPEPIRVNHEFIYVDAVLSPDPNVFSHSNPLKGLRKGGVFIIQSDLPNPQEVWRAIPLDAQQFILDNQIRFYYIDGFKIAREEASDAELQFRMQGIAFQGAFFAVPAIQEQLKMTEASLFEAIKKQLTAKFGAKGSRVVEDNLRVVRRGYDQIQEVTERQVQRPEASLLRKETVLPVMLKELPASAGKLSDLHRFWEQTGNFYARGQGNDNLVDPFIALSVIPAASGIFRDMTQIRFEYPKWLPEKCTACGDCYTVCPDSAIPGLVNTMQEIFDTAINRVERQGRPTIHLRRAARVIEKKLRALIEPVGLGVDVHTLLDQAIADTVAEATLEADGKKRLSEELDWFRASLGGFQFAVTRPYYLLKEKQQKGSGGLFSITVNPYTCKGCMECVTACNDQALVPVPQTPESVQTLRKDWHFWMDLPTTSPDYIRIESLDERIGALETLLLDKRNYGSMVCGDGACLGCGEKSVIHLFTSTVTALMQARVKKHLEKLDDLISRLEQHIRLKLAQTLDLSNVASITQAVDAHQDKDLTLTRLSASLEQGKLGAPIDSDWLKWASGLLDKLRHLQWQYIEGTTKQGRAAMGIINSTGCTSVWGSTFPYNPYPFPWASHLFQDSPSMAMGLFEGHMAKMAEGFKAVRMAELELSGEYKAEKHDKFFTYFTWREFSDEEFRLCPPVVSVGGDGAMYDIGFQNLSRMLMSGMPIKVLVVDTQTYSNTGGQSCTSGFVGQVADMAPYGKMRKGKTEIRKEMSLIGMAHRSAYVLQGAISNVSHLLEGYIEGLNTRRPALFNIYATCQPEHGVGDDAAERQSKLAVESRAYPLFRFDPDKGEAFRDSVSLEGNPETESDWPVYTLKYQDENGKEASMALPFTFADFALTEGRFRKHFKKAPQDTWDDKKMLPLAEFLDLPADEREGRFPYIWSVDKKNCLNRVLVSAEIVTSTLERRTFWRQLKSVAGLDQTINADSIVQQTQVQMARKITEGLLALATGASPGLTGLLGDAPLSAPAGSTPAPGDYVYEPVWIETAECTACDECIKLNPKLFAYNDKKQAYVKDPKAGAYKDIVKAAEKCTAGVIHPGTPFNPKEAGVDKLIQRAAAFQ